MRGLQGCQEREGDDMNAGAIFRQWLIKARAKAGLSYAQLAEKSGISSGAIHNLEHGDGSPVLDTAEKLAIALNTSLESIFRVRTIKPTKTGFEPDPCDPMC